MREDNSILLLKDYGKINIKLKELMDKNGISRYQLASMIHSRFEVVDKWYKNEVQKLDLDVLARICYVLECKPDELLEYSECIPKTC